VADHPLEFGSWDEQQRLQDDEIRQYHQREEEPV
jgi:hypothetical protein